jgi:hypothetical protein
MIICKKLDNCVMKTSIIFPHLLLIFGGSVIHIKESFGIAHDLGLMGSTERVEQQIKDILKKWHRQTGKLGQLDQVMKLTTKQGRGHNV